MINSIKKVFADYVEFEKQLTQIRCLVVDTGEKIKKLLKTFPRRYRKQAIHHAYCLAYLDYPLDEIMKELKELRTYYEKYICKHCGGDIRIRNPKGYCDHLYYPDNCDICKRRETE